MLSKAAKEQMLRRYYESLAGSEATKSFYVGQARDFLNKINFREPNRSSVIYYMGKLQERGFKDSSINLKWRILRRFFIVNGIRWPFKKNETPRIRESTVDARALHPEIIRRFIRLALDGKLTQAEAAVLALCTTYGLRIGEVVSIAPEDFDRRANIILIKTEKHGRERYHSIPDEILPWIEGYDFPKVNEDKVRAIYKSIESKAGMEHIYRTGPHAIRRTLVTMVGRYCSELEVKKFFRWGAITMPQKYTAVKFVGLEHEEIQTNEEDHNIDEKVFAQHPFLKLWGGKIDG